MNTLLTSAAVGALVRQTREAAGLTQTQLADRIGASRFWVAVFEKGKPCAELGLALKAIHALGLTIRVEAKGAQSTRPRRLGTSNSTTTRTKPAKPDTTLAAVIARTTVKNAPQSKVIGWPGSAPAMPRKRPLA